MMSLAVQQVSQPNSDRLTFLASHLYQLQTLRWLGLHLMLLLSPAFFLLSSRQNYSLLILLTVFSALWFLIFTRTVRQRFGRTELTPLQRLRIRFPSPLLAFVPAVFLLGHFYCRYILTVHNDDWMVSWSLVLWMVAPIAGKANPPVRRLAYALALAALTLIYMRFAFWTPMGDWRGALVFSSLGAILLSLAIFDYALLCRITSVDSPQTGLDA